MKYRILRDCIIGNGAKARAGDIVELSESLAKTLLSIGKVIPDNAMPKISDREVKEVQQRANKGKTTARKQPRKPAGSKVPAK
tara:strand:+ start:5363 stop:5611 length:249 start_codon:yes stop_codon:yes gene_type:complete